MKNKSHTNIRRFFPQEAIDRFKNYLLSINWEFTNNSDRSISDVNIIYNEFLDVFCNGFNTCFPLKSTSVSYRRTPRKEWMTYGLAKFCEMKSVLYKKMKRQKTIEAKQKVTVYRNKLNTLIGKAEKDFYAKKLSECHGNAKRTWKIINNLVNKNNHDPSADSS